MYINIKWLTPSCFALIIGCFFLPFLDIKCNEVPLAEVKGIDLVTGSTINLNKNKIEVPSSTKDESKRNDLDDNIKDIRRNYFAVAAFLLSISGLILSLLMRKRNETLFAAIGIGGAISLLLMRMQIDNSIARDSDGMSKYVVTIEYASGYWLSLIFFLISGLFSVYQFVEGNKIKPAKATEGTSEL